MRDVKESKIEIEMPRYKCHKEVWALKIAGITQAPANKEKMHADGDWLLKMEEPFSTIVVGHAWYTKHTPEVGGYYVVYQGGYVSYSPAKDFEEGYTRLVTIGTW